MPKTNKTDINASSDIPKQHSTINNSTINSTKTDTTITGAPSKDIPQGSSSDRLEELVIGPSHHSHHSYHSHPNLSIAPHQTSPPPCYYAGVINLLTPLYRLKVRHVSKENQNYQQELDDRFGNRYEHKSSWPTGDNITKVVWCHAVSLGETNTIAPVLKRLLSQGYHLWVTSTTQTGYARVKKLFAKELEAGQLQHSYMPVDKNKVIAKFIKHVQPDLALFVETELWATTLYQLSKNDIISILINARLSEKSYQNYLKIAKVSQSMMQNLGLIIAQDEKSAKRFCLLGADSAKVRVAGSLKWTVNSLSTITSTPLKPTDSTKDNLVKDDLKNDLKNYVQDIIGNRPVWVAASTHLGEESVALSAHKQLISTTGLEKTLLILVPRHPERFDEVVDSLTQSGLSFCRRSQLIASKHERLEREIGNQSEAERPNKLSQQSTLVMGSDYCFDTSTHVFLADSMGELDAWYELADVAFVGGSMVNVGGHNPIEALINKTPVIMGKYTYSLQAIVEQLSASGVLQQISAIYEHTKGSDLDEVSKKQLAELLYTQVKQWLLNKQETQALGQRGYELVQENQEVIERQIEMILQILQGR